MVSCLMGDSTALASAIVRCCLKYYMALSALKKMLADSVITSENYKKATVAIAERYRVLRYDI